jgi:hypothetical protein
MVDRCTLLYVSPVIRNNSETRHFFLKRDRRSFGTEQVISDFTCRDSRWSRGRSNCHWTSHSSSHIHVSLAFFWMFVRKIAAYLNSATRYPLQLITVDPFLSSSFSLRPAEHDRGFLPQIQTSGEAELTESGVPFPRPRDSKRFRSTVNDSVRVKTVGEGWSLRSLPSGWVGMRGWRSFLNKWEWTFMTGKGSIVGMITIWLFHPQPF